MEQTTLHAPNDEQGQIRQDAQDVNEERFYDWESIAHPEIWYFLEVSDEEIDRLLHDVWLRHQYAQQEADAALEYFQATLLAAWRKKLVNGIDADSMKKLEAKLGADPHI